MRTVVRRLVVAVVLTLVGALLATSSYLGARPAFAIESELRLDSQEGTRITSSGFLAMVVDGDRAFVLDVLPPDRGIQVFDVSRADAPFRVSHLPLERSEATLGASLAYAGGRLLVQTPREGLLVIDVGDPATPTLLDRHPHPGEGWVGSAVAGSNDQVYALYTDTEGQSWTGLLRHLRLDSSGDATLIKEHPLEGQPSRAVTGHGFLLVSLQHDYRAHGLGVWKSGMDDALDFVGLEPLDDTSIPAMEVISDFFAVGSSTITLFRPGPEGLQRLGYAGLGFGGIRAFTELENVLVASTANGLFAFDVTEPESLAPIELDRQLTEESVHWLRPQEDIAAIGGTLVTINHQGILTFSWDVRHPQGGNLLWLATAMMVAGSVLFVMFLAKPRRTSS
jgi:hypothetical protein